MSSRSARVRGSETQTAVAWWFKEHGWPYAEPVGAGRVGTDVTGMPGLCVEVKARRRLDLPAWLRQAGNGANGSLPMVVSRPDGFGLASLEVWPVTFTLRDATTLLLDAGYGSMRGVR